MIWEAYCNVEDTIALLKLEWGEGSYSNLGVKGISGEGISGELSKIYEILILLKDAEHETTSGKFLNVITKARCARDALAEMLLDLRRVRKS